MRLNFSEDNPKQIIVTLSERNVRALLSKLAWPESACTILSKNVFGDGEELDDWIFAVRIEPNDVHYAGRVPGEMHERTEADIRTQA